MADHRYSVRVEWTGAGRAGTTSYAGYSRDHVVRAKDRADIAGSSDPAFRGNGKRWNPEQMLLAAVSSCHQLWYLHLCAEAGVTVVAYVDDAIGDMHEEADGSGQFVGVSLYPAVTITHDSDPAVAETLHAAAAARCFIARSVSFPVRHHPSITWADRPD